MPGKKKPPKKTKQEAAAQMARLLGEDGALERCEGYRAPEKLLEHGLAVLVRVSQGEDQKLAADAGKWLVDYSMAVITERRGVKTPADGRSMVIQELRRLYARALPPQREEIVEVIPETGELVSEVEEKPEEQSN